MIILIIKHTNIMIIVIMIIIIIIIINIRKVTGPAEAAKDAAALLEARPEPLR